MKISDIATRHGKEANPIVSGTFGSAIERPHRNITSFFRGSICRRKERSRKRITSPVKQPSWHPMMLSQGDSGMERSMRIFEVRNVIFHYE